MDVLGLTEQGSQGRRILWTSNIVVDAVICHWVMVVMQTEAGTGGLGLTIIDLAAYFYADNGLVVLTQPERLHRAFDTLTGLFDGVKIKTNMGNMDSMVCQSYHAPGRMSGEAYDRQTPGTCKTFQERKRRRVECLECGIEVAAGLMLTHRQSQHVVGRWGTGRKHPPPPTPRGGPYLPGLFPKTPVSDPLPSRAVPGWGIKSDQPLDSLYVPPHAGYNFDPGGG